MGWRDRRGPVPALSPQFFSLKSHFILRRQIQRCYSLTSWIEQKRNSSRTFYRDFMCALRRERNFWGLLLDCDIKTSTCYRSDISFRNFLCIACIVPCIHVLIKLGHVSSFPDTWVLRLFHYGVLVCNVSAFTAYSHTVTAELGFSVGQRERTPTMKSIPLWTFWQKEDFQFLDM